jgi:hypothetical protein
MTRQGRLPTRTVSPIESSSPNSSRTTVCPSRQTWAALVTWPWLNISPAIKGQLRTPKYSGVTPWTAVPQFAPR